MVWLIVTANCEEHVTENFLPPIYHVLSPPYPVHAIAIEGYNRERKFHIRSNTYIQQFIGLRHSARLDFSIHICIIYKIKFVSIEIKWKLDILKYVHEMHLDK